ncbi:glycoside hydrolase family 20 zincin-like fold domain-containing protein [Niabella sp. CC-SYL272]|uniref:alpha-d-galacturonidase n=1 Tax=Niabella agricola TaxID=2891571 RepID=UPI001F1816EF|nr:glycoside hydrolase family 20 zincin-like fold domain-containing protein [Niabella agricola]MCF3109200.1 glycoside hydrolase family 20 zincin-like fold domain-containing protein [Niabella agricola]
MRGGVTIFLLALAIKLYALPGKGSVTIGVPSAATERVKYGADQLKNTLIAAGYTVHVNPASMKQANGTYIGLHSDAGGKKESFSIEARGVEITITGADATGILYGCLALADKVKESGELPKALSFSDAPEMVLRGACIGIQKPYYLPGHNVYEYPYTPQTFPWLYDKKLWIQVLDSMVYNRMNSLYLWNGHPFASLVKLKDYPYAVEVDEATFKKNEEMYRFLTTEADKRGIWVIQMFYNIIVSKPFAEKNHLKTQERERPIIPVIADYTRKSIAAFVEKYPNVGLMVCLGEAMEGIGNDDIEWFTKTIIPGVRDGMKTLGITEEPPIVLRAHDTDAPAVMKAALPLYKNLYTEAKFNGEALTVPRPRGTWAQLHQTLSQLGSMHIANVHILANLEPFRYGSPDFIQQSVLGMNEVLGAHGLHLYPESSYWDWPYSADSIRGGERLLQIERDWIWYKAWSRYAWRSKRNRQEEIGFWSERMGDQFGIGKEKGAAVLQAYEAMGEIAPKLLRRFGITDGNRQTLTLGMLMTQLINPYRYGLFTLLYDGESPEGEMLIDYADKEWKGNAHHGETPVQIAREVRAHGDAAVAALKTIGNVSKNKEEFARIENDAACYRALAYHYAAKTEAALLVLRYKYSDDIKDLEKALPLLKESVDWYKKLVSLTEGTYLYANSMQTQQRKIPIRGVDGTFKTWKEVLVPFEKELTVFQHKLDSLKSNPKVNAVKTRPYIAAKIMNKDKPVARFFVDSLAQPFSDTTLSIRSLAPELKGLKGLKLSYKAQLQQGTFYTFSNTRPVKVLVGFFQPQKSAFAKDTFFLKAPELETNALANDYGQAETRIANALVIPGMPQLNVHMYEFKPGINTLKLEKGVAIVLGFIEGSQPVKVYDAGLYESGNKKQVDWLFE